MSSFNDSEMAYGCLFCRTGIERELAGFLKQDHPSLDVIAAEKLRRRRQGQSFINEEVLLFPGYLFFRTDAGFPVRELTRRQDVFKVLQSCVGDWQLHGSDEAFVRRLFEQKGVIGFSKAYFEGDRIRIVDGMLKECEGKILRVNRRAQTAQVSIGGYDREITAWLGFELIEKNEIKE